MSQESMVQQSHEGPAANKAIYRQGRQIASFAQGNLVHTGVTISLHILGQQSVTFAV